MHRTFFRHPKLRRAGLFLLLYSLISEPGGGSDKVPKSYDLIGGLFREMNTPGTTGGGYFKGVNYFDGGLFDEVYPIEINLA